ncbi:UDP-N-acetylmuramate dehydrogenase [Anaerolineales bacterium HSG25]|nr:UDP-N-acetylmuramate dehydrogenase [Anaerolineales bacterium HSG25]
MKKPFSVAFSQQFGSRFRLDEPLANHTTFRLGGPAKFWVAPETIDELVAVVTSARQYKVPFLMLGGGANLLVRESGFNGLVIQNRVNQVNFPTVEQQSVESAVTVEVESGVVLPNFARRCAKRGLSGFEWAIGIPGTIGGAVVNNSGAYGNDMAQTMYRAELLSPTNERVWQFADWFLYQYRFSRLKGRTSRLMSPTVSVKRTTTDTDWIVLRAELQLTSASVAEVEQRMKQFNNRRKATQPAGATIGSMFKNPPNDYAGRLIEATGLKGYQVGQAQISPLHANFFQNLGGATATDVLALIETARKTVHEQFNINLELEIEVVGD